MGIKKRGLADTRPAAARIWRDSSLGVDFAVGGEDAAGVAQRVLQDGVAAVDGERLAGDEAGFFAGEVDHAGGDVERACPCGRRGRRRR